ncbi:MAG: hypothetical protein PQJ59_16390 [Spirochaetales bacterium]|nr:hypothetical protein [Spirochaetales bacterium]
MDKDFGVLTLATKRDYIKAVAMACSMREVSPGIPICIVCTQQIADIVGQYFDYVVIERKGIKGFAHKILLDEYSPFNKTFFIDADMLVYKDIRKMIDDWGEKRYAAGGSIIFEGKSSFGLDRNYVLNKISKEKFSDISGAGHAYFEKPHCTEVFELGRKIMANYTDYANPCRFADEDVIGIAMSILDIAPVDSSGYIGMPNHAINNSFRSNILEQKCSYVDELFGETEPTAVHFAAMQQPLVYAREQQRLLNKNHIKIKGLWKKAFLELYTTKVLWPLAAFRRKLKGIDLNSKA